MPDSLLHTHSRTLAALAKEVSPLGAEVCPLAQGQIERAVACILEAKSRLAQAHRVQEQVA